MIKQSLYKVCNFQNNLNHPDLIHDNHLFILLWVSNGQPKQLITLYCVSGCIEECGGGKGGRGGGVYGI